MDHSKNDRKAFDPADPAYRFKLWVRVVAPGTSWVHVFWKRIALAGLALAILGWLGAAAAFWGFVRFQRGYTEVSYFDLVLYPVRKDHYRAGLGQFYLERGREALQKQNYREGYALLQAGVVRLPGDMPGRRSLAYLQVRFGRADLALRTLSEGAGLAGADLDYLKLLFGLLLETREDDRLIALAKSLLPPNPDTVLTHLFIALEMATAHFERGRYDEAERIVADWQLTKSLEGIILLAKCDWERGFPDRALQRLEAEIARFPKRDELYLHIVRYHRELGHAAEARRYALLRQFNDPASPGPRVDLIYTYHGTGDKAAEARELAAYFHDFTVDPNALVLLTWFAVETVQPDLADRVAIVAKERNYPLDAFAIGRVQAQLAAQHYQAALDLALTGMREDNAENAAFNTTLNGLRCVALFGLKDNTRAEAMLRSFVGQAKLRPAEALLLARQLRLIGTLAAARLVLARATVVDPLNQAALAELVRIDAETGNREKLTENIPRLLRMRKPSRAVLEETLLRLNQPADAALRDQIREAISRSSATPVP